MVGGIQWKVTALVVVLGAAGMLLVGLVAMLFWEIHLVDRERVAVRSLLDHALLASPYQLVLAPRVGDCIFLFPDQGEPVRRYGEAVEGLSGEVRDEIIAAARETQDFGAPQDRVLGPGFMLFMQKPKWVLATARHRGRDGDEVFAVARSLANEQRVLKRSAGFLLLYTAINLLLLALLAADRVRRRILRPLEELVLLAEQYTDKGQALQVSEEAGDEVAQLTSSLNRMLVRIDDDRQRLQRLVAQLSDANDQLIANQQEMIRAEKMASVGRLAAGLAHEIGNPLGIIQGYHELLVRIDNQQLRQEYLRRADQELARVVALVRQLLDFARGPVGRLELIDVADAVADVVELVASQPRARNVCISQQRPAEPCMVLIDGNQFRQVVLNCLLNSLDAIEEQDRAVQGQIGIMFALKDETLPTGTVRWLDIVIDDSGCGLPAGLEQTLFEPFVTSKEPGRGTGLGLSVSQRIIEQAGGEIIAGTSPMGGARFLIRLPLASEIGSSEQNVDE